MSKYFFYTFLTIAFFNSVDVFASQRTLVEDEDAQTRGMSSVPSTDSNLKDKGEKAAAKSAKKAQEDLKKAEAQSKKQAKVFAKTAQKSEKAAKLLTDPDAQAQAYYDAGAAKREEAELLSQKDTAQNKLLAKEAYAQASQYFEQTAYYATKPAAQTLAHFESGGAKIDEAELLSQETEAHKREKAGTLSKGVECIARGLNLSVAHSEIPTFCEKAGKAKRAEAKLLSQETESQKKMKIETFEQAIKYLEKAIASYQGHWEKEGAKLVQEVSEVKKEIELLSQGIGAEKK